MTSQGSASSRFSRAIQQRNLFAAEVALKEMGTPSLLVAIDYLLLLADERPAKDPLAAWRWHVRFELGAATLTVAGIAARVVCAGRDRRRESGGGQRAAVVTAEGATD